MDASNLLKPMLGRGELRCIGATTLDEYRKYIEKDPALERRFQQVYVDQPSVVATIAILRGLRERCVQIDSSHSVLATGWLLDHGEQLWSGRRASHAPDVPELTSAESALLGGDCRCPAWLAGEACAIVQAFTSKHSHALTVAQLIAGKTCMTPVRRVSMLPIQPGSVLQE